MALPNANRHAAIGAIAIGAVFANLVLRVDWVLALLAGGAVLLFGELSPRFLPNRPPRAALPTAAFHPLSKREVEVGRHVSEGMTNKDIAKQSYRSERTIDNQVTSIYTKLNIHSRAELALWMRDHGLLDDKENPKNDGKPKDGRPKA
jgi:DNA-binding NarL/FixJ family response regulator